MMMIIIIITDRNSHIGHCTHTSESANVKEQKANAGTRNRDTVNNKYRIAATMYPLGTWFVSGIYVWIPCIKETMILMLMIMMVMMMIIIIIPWVSPVHISKDV